MPAKAGIHDFFSVPTNRALSSKLHPQMSQIPADQKKSRSFIFSSVLICVICG
jgi:hypothetical protein